MNKHKEISDAIEEAINSGGKDFAIYPLGGVGLLAKNILNTKYGIEERYIIDDEACKYNKQIISLEAYRARSPENVWIILCTFSHNVYQKLHNTISDISGQNIVSFASARNKPTLPKWTTKIGKYSYGPICHNSYAISEIGSFCSFAEGVAVVKNHEMNYISLHPMLYLGKQMEGITIDYNAYSNLPYFFEGVNPHDNCVTWKRTIIGSDVWIGRNVTIIGGVQIGNGVIAGAGSIITHDVPDYAVVVGAPARIIRYRYTQSQIDELNKIKWWDWSDNLIRERFGDFYLPIDEFIKKYRI